MSKLEQLMNIDGYFDIDEILEKSVFDSECPGICTNLGCGYTASVEPDCSDGWCEDCQTNSVQSALILMGVI